MFLKKMTENEKKNASKGIVIGFFVYASLLGFSSYQYIAEKELTFSPLFIFLTGIVSAFIYELLLNLKNRKS